MFVSFQTSSTTKARTEYDAMQFENSRSKPSSKRPTKASPVATMSGSPRQEKYGKAGYGGLQRKKMPMSSVGNAICAKGWDNWWNKLGCHTNPSFRWNHFKNGGLDFVGPFKPPTARTGNKYIMWSRTSAQNGSRERLYRTTRRHPRPNSCTNISGAITDAQ